MFGLDDVGAATGWIRAPKMTKTRVPKMPCLPNIGDVKFWPSRFGARTYTRQLVATS